MTHDDDLSVGALCEMNRDFVVVRRFPKAATVMRWRYKADGNGQLMLGDDGRPIR